MRMNLRFHWALPLDGEKASAASPTRSGIPDMPSMIRFCQAAEEAGIDSLLVAFGFHMPDPIPLVAALSEHTEKIKFMIAYRSGLMSPTLFVQQINTLSQLTGSRISLNMVAGISPEEQAYYGDFCAHDDRYHRADEFLSVCKSFWAGDGDVNHKGKYFSVVRGRLNTPFLAAEAAKQSGPEIYLGGNSGIAQQVALKHAACWLRYADRPQKIKESAERVLEQGMEVGLRLSVIARPTREQALEHAYGMIENPDLSWKEFIRRFVQSCDSVAVKETFALVESDAESEWLTPYLWTGAVPYRGGPAVSLVGTSDEIASELMNFKRAGVTQFILSGWPNIDEMVFFGREIIPKVRDREHQAASLHDPRELAAPI